MIIHFDASDIDGINRHLTAMAEPASTAREISDIGSWNHRGHTGHFGAASKIKAARRQKLQLIRDYYKSLGHQVRIGKDGRVSFRKDGAGAWLDGRWVSEYVVENGSVKI